jgi:hypothetical protein
MITPEPDGVVWRISSYSGTGSACVEVAPAAERVLVRDSKDPHGPALAVSPSAWRTFLITVTG